MIPVPTSREDSPSRERAARRRFRRSKKRLTTKAQSRRAGTQSKVQDNGQKNGQKNLVSWCCSAKQRSAWPDDKRCRGLGPTGPNHADAKRAQIQVLPSGLTMAPAAAIVQFVEGTSLPRRSPAETGLPLRSLAKRGDCSMVASGASRCLSAEPKNPGSNKPAPRHSRHRSGRGGAGRAPAPPREHRAPSLRAAVPGAAQKAAGPQPDPRKGRPTKERQELL